jgi:hypothetical protein
MPKHEAVKLAVDFALMMQHLTHRLSQALQCGSLLCAGLVLCAAAHGRDAPDWVEVEILVFIHERGGSDAWPVARDLASLRDFSFALLDPVERRWQAAGTARSELEELFAAWPGLDSATRRVLFERLSSELRTVVNLDTGVPPSPWWPDPMIDRLDGFNQLSRSAQRLDRHSDYRLISQRAWRQALAPAARTPHLRINGGAPLWIDWTAPPRIQRGPGWRIDPALGLPPTVWQLEGQLRLVQRQFTHIEIDLTWRQPAASTLGPLRSEFLAPYGYAEHRLVESRSVQRERIEYIDSGWLGVLVRIAPFNHPLDGVDLRPPERSPEFSDQPGGQVN